MPLAIARVVVGLFEVYALSGVVFAAFFLPRGIARIDPRVASAPKVLRALIAPGVMALWPLFAWRWIAGVQAPVERNPHRAKAAAPPSMPRRTAEIGR